MSTSRPDAGVWCESAGMVKWAKNLVGLGGSRIGGRAEGGTERTGFGDDLGSG